MKTKDIALVIIVAGISLMASYAILDKILESSGHDEIKVKVVSKINDSLEDPDPTVFNSNAINPTMKIVIGQD